MICTYFSTFFSFLPLLLLSGRLGCPGLLGKEEGKRGGRKEGSGIARFWACPGTEGSASASTVTRKVDLMGMMHFDTGGGARNSPGAFRIGRPDSKPAPKERLRAEPKVS